MVHCSTGRFTEESSFAVMHTKIRCRVWRMKSTHNDMKYVTPKFKSAYKIVNVWGVFSVYEQTPLVRTNDRFNQHKYRKITNEFLLPFMMKEHGGNKEFGFQEDNCDPHRGKSIAKYLHNKAVRLIQAISCFLFYEANGMHYLIPTLLSCYIRSLSE